MDYIWVNIFKMKTAVLKEVYPVHVTLIVLDI